MRELLHARRSATALLASVSLATGALAQRAPTIRDSAGVRIVEHGVLSRRAAPFRIGVDATVDLDVLRDDPDEELTARRPYLTGRRLSDGRWILIDFATLKLYDERGRYVRTIGRKGSGPGEFRQLREVCVAPGDTIIGISLADRRISTFDSTGKHVRSIVAPGSVLLDPCFPDGSFLVRLAPQGNPASKHSPKLAELMDRVSQVERIRWDGTPVGSLGLLQINSADQTFGDMANIVVGDGRVHVGNGIEPEYRVYSGAGKLLQIVRWQAPRVAVTPEMREERLRRGYLSGPWAREALPYYGRIRLGPNDHVWVPDYRTPGDLSTTFTVFDRGGELIGRIAMPMESPVPVDVPWIGTDRILVGWRERDGAPHLGVHVLISQEPE